MADGISVNLSCLPSWIMLIYPSKCTLRRTRHAVRAKRWTKPLRPRSRSDASKRPRSGGHLDEHPPELDEGARVRLRVPPGTPHRLRRVSLAAPARDWRSGEHAPESHAIDPSMPALNRRPGTVVRRVARSRRMRLARWSPPYYESGPPAQAGCRTNYCIRHVSGDTQEASRNWLALHRTGFGDQRLRPPLDVKRRLRTRLLARSPASTR